LTKSGSVSANGTQRWIFWAGLAVACAGFAFLNAVSWYPAYRNAGPYAPGWNRALTWELVRWELWVPMTALILRWVRKYPERGENKIGNTLRVIEAGILFPALHTVFLVAIYFPLAGGRLGAFLHYRSFVLVINFLAGIIVTGLVMGISRARDYQSQLREEEIRATRLEAQLSQAQLNALKMQLQPHFLFNTLNAISSMQMENPESAQRMLVRLSEFLRLTLEDSGQTVTLRREMDFAARYLEIERVRFPDKLSVWFDLAPETLDAIVPNLILQPIVENAVRHGIAAKTEPGKIELRSTHNNGFLKLQVRDTGPGFARGSSSSRITETPMPGIGLANIRGRLERLYGSSFRFSVDDAEGGGVLATIEIPFQEETQS
jgi:two-component system LytT family sensor kinase